jgi:hypothetical protein
LVLRREELLQYLVECVPVSCDACSYRCFVFFARSRNDRRFQSSFCHGFFHTHHERITHFKFHRRTIELRAQYRRKSGYREWRSCCSDIADLIAFLVMKLKKRKQGVEKGAGDVPSIAEQEKEYYTHQYQTGPSEMLAVDKSVEMVGSRYVAELPGSHGI